MWQEASNIHGSIMYRREICSTPMNSSLSTVVKRTAHQNQIHASKTDLGTPRKSWYYFLSVHGQGFHSVNHVQITYKNVLDSVGKKCVSVSYTKCAHNIAALFNSVLIIVTFKRLRPVINIKSIVL